MTLAHLGRLNADGSLDDELRSGRERSVVLRAGGAAGWEDPGRRQFSRRWAAAPPADARQHSGGSTRTARSTPASIPARTVGVYAMAVQADGKILVGGAFTTLGGGGTGTTPRNYIGRLNADGTLDTSFDPGANGAIVSMAVQPDGKILVGRRVHDAGRRDRHHAAYRIGRLNADGSARQHLQSRRKQRRVRHGAAGGREGPGRRRLHRPERGGDRRQSAITSGGLPPTARSMPASIRARMATSTRWRCRRTGRSWPVANSPCSAAAGPARRCVTRIGRLTNTGMAIQSLSVTSAGGVVTWARSGVGPEFRRVTFESSTDGATYTPLGSGTPVPGGWRLSGLAFRSGRTSTSARGASTRRGRSVHPAHRRIDCAEDVSAVQR